MITATYHYRTSNYRGGYTSHLIRVEIIDESDKSYRVKYLEPGTFGQYAGTVKWVRKRNLSNIMGAGMTVRTVPHLEETRLPYKD
jgi:hypothetical protein